MSIGRFQLPSDMARVLQVHVNQAEFNAILEHKISVVFIPYDSKLAKYLVLDERLTSNGEKEYWFRQFDFVEFYYKDTYSTRVLCRLSGFSVTRSCIFDRRHRLIDFSALSIAIHFS